MIETPNDEDDQIHNKRIFASLSLHIILHLKYIFSKRSSWKRRWFYFYCNFEEKKRKITTQYKGQLKSPLIFRKLIHHSIVFPALFLYTWVWLVSIIIHDKWTDNSLLLCIDHTHTTSTLDQNAKVDFKSLNPKWKIQF